MLKLFIAFVILISLIVGALYVVQSKTTEQFTEDNPSEKPEDKKKHIEDVFQAVIQRQPHESELSYYMTDDYPDNVSVSLAIVRDADVIRKGELTDQKTNDDVPKQIPVDAFSRRFVETTVNRLRDSVRNLQAELDKVNSELDAVAQFI